MASNKNKIPVITIDGPSGSGKGTLSQLLARELGWHLLDSGALYRVLALAAMRHSVALDNAEALEILAAHLDVQFQAESQGGGAKIILEGDDVTETIRSPECGSKASIVAALPGVRKALLARQEAFREAPGLVADGRDMGSVVFPDAGLKIFLEASVAARAGRRYAQLQEKSINVSLDTVLAEISERDLRDTGRSVAPLRPAHGALIIDTTYLDIDAVFGVILAKAKSILQ